jgi:endonuclease/exonuclease/phosphatase family metal-dependent hydrolase
MRTESYGPADHSGSGGAKPVRAEAAFSECGNRNPRGFAIFPDGDCCVTLRVSSVPEGSKGAGAMRVASFNVESLFDRAKALSLPTWADGRKILEAYAKTNALLNEPVYTPAIKAQLVDQLIALGLRKEDQPKDGFALLRQNRGRLVKRTKVGKDVNVEIVADGRESWIGWVELTKEPTDELATEHTAMVIRDLNADVLGVVEADNRAALQLFSELMLNKVGGKGYQHVMLIDGNDDRGIDVGILTRTGYDILEITSHVDDAHKGKRIFSRDCPVYTLRTKKGNRLVVLVNHLKSKGYGPPSVSSALREAQAGRIATIYRALVKAGEQHIVVLGDFNDYPGSPPLQPLLAHTNLKDISKHPAFTNDGLEGTFGRGSPKEKFDYLLLSPTLYAKVIGGAVFRKGVWGENKNPPTKWQIYPTITKPVQAASDHAAIYADIDL